jgi:hypothetical protein
VLANGISSVGIAFSDKIVAGPMGHFASSSTIGLPCRRASIGDSLSWPGYHSLILEATSSIAPLIGSAAAVDSGVDSQGQSSCRSLHAS